MTCPGMTPCCSTAGNLQRVNSFHLRPDAGARRSGPVSGRARTKTMSETAIVGENVEVEVLQANAATGNTPFSWSAAIAGAFAATAVAFIIISLGSGIGLSLASPYGPGPSVKALTIAGAVWLVMAHAFGFAAGGYLAG